MASRKQNNKWRETPYSHEKFILFTTKVYLVHFNQADEKL
ncbi:MAG: hypothetical protein RHS_2831 [Robinsoniella sp. RHS]|nr:MAG: hypothetical protein RHS_5004 [Robinsoniella sp. RHS]KLU71357.1 MAG: hypothetical protein RHS_2831 [Robinsoniella sp. RHS]